MLTCFEFDMTITDILMQQRLILRLSKLEVRCVVDDRRTASIQTLTLQTETINQKQDVLIYFCIRFNMCVIRTQATAFMQ